MTKPIILTKAECRPIMKAAFERGELQAQKVGTKDGCFYAGPCVIGVCLPPRKRKSLDKAENLFGTSDTDIGTLIEAGIVRTDDDDWFIERQSAHDKDDMGRLRRLLGAKKAAA